VIELTGIPLVDPYLKTSRAKSHLEDLRQRLAVFCEDPCDFLREDDLENQLHIVRMKVKDIPDELPLILGDLLYCLLSALDQTVWCLAKINATPGYPEQTQFPILEQRDATRFSRQTRGVPAEAARIIESLQPYNAPSAAEVREHLLWRLNKLCIIDKHIRIPIHGVAGTVTWDTFVPFGAKDFTLTEFDDNMVMKIPLSRKSQMALNPRVPEFKVLFGDLYWKIECDFAGIETIYEFVTNNVIPRFARFFKQLKCPPSVTLPPGMTTRPVS
jgi:hypothetical protein